MSAAVFSRQGSPLLKKLMSVHHLKEVPRPAPLRGLYHTISSPQKRCASLPALWKRSNTTTYLHHYCTSLLLKTMNPSNINSVGNAPRLTCTYVMRIERATEEDMTTPEQARLLLQNFLGPEHEVMSANRMRFNTIHTDNSCIDHHVIKVRTCMPEAVATRLIGNTWVKEEHILFKAPEHVDGNY
eukprot:scaffold33607_cov84-Skeletonema_dohrnii-CCMP3373.AAC.1